MKGVSTIIATILMLMITIGLAGTAYTFINASFKRELQGIDISDSYCTAGTQARIAFRNIGTSEITFVGSGGTFADCTISGNVATCGSVTVTRTSGGGTLDMEGDRSPVGAGAPANLIDRGCTTVGVARSCVYRITPPAGRTIEAAVSCTG